MGLAHHLRCYKHLAWSTTYCLSTLMGLCGTAQAAPGSLARQRIAPEGRFPANAATLCEALAAKAIAWPDPTTRLVSTHWVMRTVVAAPASEPAPAPVEMPEHCEVIGMAQERVGEGGQHYAIRFHLRLPSVWNERFFFQGGGGSDGILGDARGSYSPAALPALVQGFAVLSQDSGHDNDLNNDPDRAGVLVYGFDAQARANYGHASLAVAANAAKAVIRVFYGRASRYSYFVGCSKGGEEGMALAERYPLAFDGIAASAPGMSLPRAAIAEAWDTQALATSIKGSLDPHLSVAELATAFSDTDRQLVKTAVLEACDGDDGLKDGIIGDISRCTSSKVSGRLEPLRCASAKTPSCLSTDQITALEKIIGGVKNSQGDSLYSDWPWDTGIAAPGWRAWKLGRIDSPRPSLNVILGAPSLASTFTTPPSSVHDDPQSLLGYLLTFDFDRDAPKIYAHDDHFQKSAWEDNSARSSDLRAFRQRAGKLIVVHGVSDPVFSINDTLAWWREVDRNSAGEAGDFARIFPVPGMTHCGGGDSTDQYDVLQPLVRWVERGVAPDRILARARVDSPWPKRERPLCAYPSVARYRGGDTERQQSFVCRK